MPILFSVVSWVAMVLLVVPLALALILVAIPSGAVVQIAMHVILLVAGAALVLALREAR